MSSYDAVGKVIAATAMEGVKRRGSIHYTQTSRRWNGIRNNVIGPRQPNYCDCSSYTTWLMWQGRKRVRKTAGKDIVNGLNWRAGYTGSQIKHGRKHKLGVRGYKVGRTLIFYGNPVSHVAIYVGNGMVVSHGSEKGPLYLRYNYRAINHARCYLP